MLSFSSVFNSGGRGGGMTNPGDQLRRQGRDRGTAANGGRNRGSFNPASPGAQFSVTGGNSPRNRGRRAMGAIAAAGQARRAAR